jgi:hypothetical protein
MSNNIHRATTYNFPLGGVPALVVVLQPSFDSIQIRSLSLDVIGTCMATLLSTRFFGGRISVTKTQMQ